MRAEDAEREAAFAARWGASAFAGRWLRTSTGERLAVLFPGRPGGPAGPDFRDAVLLCPDGSRLYGDVEIHLRARGWHQHGHASDQRYNRVVLHVVRRADGARATPLASGGWVPLVELDVGADPPAATAPCAFAWPCDRLAQRVPPAHLRELLSAAGTARLGERAAAFEGILRDPSSEEPKALDSSRADRALFVALAEGLAYGREREGLRAAGRWLADGNAPEGLLRDLARVPALDAVRLEGLLTLYARWAATGPWQPLRAALEQGTEGEGVRALIDALSVPRGMVSRARAAILAANVVLPFALAMAALYGDEHLAGRARALFAALPGLPSNQITRAMLRQIGLSRAPAGACAQQGLHHLWAHFCREKHCAACPCAQAGVENAFAHAPSRREREVCEAPQMTGIPQRGIYCRYEHAIR